MSPRVALIVDDDAVTRLVHMQALYGIAGLHVMAASSVAEARQLIEAAGPTVAILDLELADGTGLEVLAALEQAGQTSRVIVVSSHLDSLGAGLSQRTSVIVREKPVPPEQLRELVQQGLAEMAAPQPFSPVEYVQMACLGRHSVRIDCEGSDTTGSIFVQNGEVVHAQDADGEGADALSRMLGEAPRVSCRTLSRPPASTTISGRWEQLLLDSLRIADERANVPDQDLDWEGAFGEEVGAPVNPLATNPPSANPPSANPPAANPPAASLSFHELKQWAVKAVSRGDLAGAREAYLRADELRPGDSVVMMALRRLERLDD